MKTEDMISLGIAGLLAYVAYRKYGPKSSAPPPTLHPMSSPPLQTITFDPSVLNPAVVDYTDTQNPPGFFELIGLAAGGY